MVMEVALIPAIPRTQGDLSWWMVLIAIVGLLLFMVYVRREIRKRRP